jgi:hypothetical protein
LYRFIIVKYIDGLLNDRTMTPLLGWLIRQGKPQLALEIARIFLNWYNVKGVYAAYAEAQQRYDLMLRSGQKWLT